MTRTIVTRRAALGGAALLGLAACQPSPPSRLYTLVPVDRPGDETAKRRSRPPIVGLGPIRFPDYLDRPQIVTRVSATRMTMADLDTWSEPLETLFARTLQENLSRLLRTENILLLPTQRAIVTDVDVEVEVLRFDADTERNVGLDARWRLVGPDGRATKVGRSTIAEVAKDGPYMDEVTSALSRCMGQMSREIAAAIEADIAARS
jgi:uncharacterized lipoprotein YmbA